MVFPTGPYHPTWDGDGSDWPSRELSQFVTTGGCRFHFQRSIPDAPGTKKLLFLHGTGAATHSWVPTVNLLNNEYECLNLDLPGHGFSRARAAAKPTLPGVADSIAALLYSLSFDPDLIVGHSAGAAIAIQLATQNLEQTKKVVAINAAFQPFPGSAKFIFPTLAKMLFLNPFTPYLFAESGRRAGRVEALMNGTGSVIDEDTLRYYRRLMQRPGHIEGALRMMANWDLLSFQRTAERFDGWIHLVAAANDKTIPATDLEKNAALFSSVETSLVEGLGHLSHEEDPTLVADLIRQALRA